MTGPKDKAPAKRKQQGSCHIYGHALMPDDWKRSPDPKYAWEGFCPNCNRVVHSI